jgi:hypothetical protein
MDTSNVTTPGPTTPAPSPETSTLPTPTPTTGMRTQVPTYPQQIFGYVGATIPLRVAPT